MQSVKLLKLKIFLKNKGISSKVDEMIFVEVKLIFSNRSNDISVIVYENSISFPKLN